MAHTIMWHGHACFQIVSGDINILIDPFFTGNPNACCAWEDIVAPDLVLVTHVHDDHVGDAVAICHKFSAQCAAVVGAAAHIQHMGLSPELIYNGIGFNIGGTVSYKGAAITMTEAFHTADAGVPVGYIITLPNGYTIYHAGDTGIFYNMKMWGALYPIDLALLPMGGVFTMDARQAAKAAQLLGAKAVIPMHWGTFPVLAQDITQFEEELQIQAPQCKFVGMQAGQSIAIPC